jgi:hypothetical protein
MVTPELSVTTLAELAVLIMMCWGIYLVVTQLRRIHPRPRSPVRQPAGTLWPSAGPKQLPHQVQRS